MVKEISVDANIAPAILNTWNHIKQEIRQIYGSIPNQNFVYFLREAEFRLNISKLTNEDKLKIFRNILKNVYNLNNYDFYDLDEISSFDNYDI